MNGDAFSPCMLYLPFRICAGKLSCPPVSTQLGCSIIYLQGMSVSIKICFVTVTIHSYISCSWPALGHVRSSGKGPWSVWILREYLTDGGKCKVVYAVLHCFRSDSLMDAYLYKVYNHYTRGIGFIFISTNLRLSVRNKEREKKLTSPSHYHVY